LGSVFYLDLFNPLSSNSNKEAGLEGLIVSEIIKIIKKTKMYICESDGTYSSCVNLKEVMKLWKLVVMPPPPKSPCNSIDSFYLEEDE